MDAVAAVLKTYKINTFFITIVFSVSLASICVTVSFLQHLSNERVTLDSKTPESTELPTLALPFENTDQFQHSNNAGCFPFVIRINELDYSSDTKCG